MLDLNKEVLANDLRKLKQKRGQGEEKKYTPFIYVHEFSSLGECCRSPSMTVGRTHHLFSRLEVAALICYDLFKNTSDIKEQYPLPIEDTFHICKQRGIQHPRANENHKVREKPKTSKLLSVMTTDLLINFEDRKPLAINVKYQKDLADKRNCEKFQIEKEYWQNNNIDWLLFTELQAPKMLLENVEWIHDILIKDEIPSENENENRYQDSEIISVLTRITSYNNYNVTALCANLDDDFGFRHGYHLGVFRFATAKRLLNAPLLVPFYKWTTNMIELTPGLFARSQFNASK